ncbi:MAG: ornithine carbamoyltransferase [Chlorobi bacterium]|nr:ornithine carbamoyltransferase [Chlorobiota bacterium]
MKKDFLSLLDLGQGELNDLFELADELKLGNHFKPLEGKVVALIFQKPSLRTRVSFEIGIHQLGGYPVFLPHESVGIGSRESAADAGRLLSRYSQMVIARVFEHNVLLELAENASIPVVNALSDLSHPCQVLADMYTLRQHGKLRPGVKVVFVGDGNNIVNSWLEMSMLYPMHFVLAAPAGYGPDPKILQQAMAAGRSRIEIVEDPMAAAHDADVLYTDVWTSMGQEEEQVARKKAFAGYQVDFRLLGEADRDCVVMHCLPAHRGEEISADVLDGKHSIVFDQAENRLHVQKALLARMIDNRALVGAPLQYMETGELPLFSS